MTAIAFDNSFARLPEPFFARVNPETVPDPTLIRLNTLLAAELGLDAAWLASPPGIAMLSGQALPESADPIAMVYAGHQFGGFSPQLGDGRAILLGEVVGPDGVRRDIQLKGSGRTPYSRQGDGKSPIGPVLREYIVSEAMAALGVPTTRALAAVATGEIVHRETRLPGAILTRVASSHVRVGTFEYFRSIGDIQLSRRLRDYVIDRHYPEVRESENPTLALLEGVARRQARLIAKWMQLGFIHGVMNTDNMQIAGETIDFGPCAFMEKFDPATVFSSIDRHGRYAWQNQPGIGQWNLARLAEALLPLLAENEDQAIARAEGALAVFASEFGERYRNGFREKLGLSPVDDSRAEAGEAFLNETLSTLTAERVDFTLFFRRLTQVAAGGPTHAFLALFESAAAGEAWLASWRQAFESADSPDDDAIERMRHVNPIFIPRNHRVHEAIEQATQGDCSSFERLTEVLTQPFDEQPEHADLERPALPNEVVRRTFCGT
jgi:uncharacterized protein YdiU (UPF0061 family)